MFGYKRRLLLLQISLCSSLMDENDTLEVYQVVDETNSRITIRVPKREISRKKSQTLLVKRFDSFVTIGKHNLDYSSQTSKKLL